MYLKITSLAPDPYIVKELVLVVCYFTWLNGIWGNSLSRQHVGSYIEY